MLTDEQRARLLVLGPAQLEIGEKWDREHEERTALFDLAKEALDQGDKQKHNELIIKSLSVGHRTQCEHDRSIFLPCSGCDAIDKALNPDMFCAFCGYWIDGQDEEPPFVRGICDDCTYQKYIFEE